MLLAREFEALAVEFQARFLKFAFSQGQDRGGETLEGDEFSIEFDLRDDAPLVKELGVTHGEIGDKMPGADAERGDMGGALGEAARIFEGVLDGARLEGVSLAPFGEVLLGDWPAVEDCVDKRGDGWVVVQPVQDALRGFACCEAGVDPGSEFEGKFCDNSLVLFHLILLFWVGGW